MLSVRNIESYYGPIAAIKGLSMEIQSGKITVLLGANGAGKTSVLKTISGAIEPQKGKLTFNEVNITGKDPAETAKLGIAHVPEGREVFPFLNVEENLLLGAYSRNDLLVKEDLELVYHYFPILKEKSRQQAMLLSGGQQQMLAIGRGLMLRPKIILLDEPSLGLSPRLVSEMGSIIRRLNLERKITILLVEQNAKLALSIGDYGFIMEAGRIVMEDTCDKLKHSPDIKEFYLGMKDVGQRGTRRWKQRKTWR
ncbi:MAG: ABC transporter ATP-binding protein [Pseudomonadota bacterium]|jgi:branched-chain amino acid transport system ATP-binding protein|nr:ABC transporter ATP-binding protein [Pseudomonadota bacterium]